MVDALRETHRILAPGGVLVDARPDSRVVARVERQTGSRFQRYGLVGTNRLALKDDRLSDIAIAHVKRQRLFKSRRRGRFWHQVPFESLVELRDYLWDHLRFARRARWSVDAVTLRRHAADRFVIRRAIRYEVLSAIKATVPSTARAASDPRMQ